VSDKDRALSGPLGLVHPDVVPGHDALYPTKMLIDARGRVLWAWGEDDMRVRSGPAAVLEHLDGLRR
jgi:peroxiredoxin